MESALFWTPDQDFDYYLPSEAQSAASWKLGAAELDVPRRGSAGKGCLMGLDFAIDELYATHWTPLDTSGCTHHTDGRAYPSIDRIRREFADAGFAISLRHVQLFDCFRAEWRDASGSPAGAVVGRTEAEAAVYALSQLRRGLVGAA
jgi:hypothetical protein